RRRRYRRSAHLRRATSRGPRPPPAPVGPGPRPGVADAAATGRGAAAHLLPRPGAPDDGAPDDLVRCGMTEITRRAVLGCAAGGALIGALPAGTAFADDRLVHERVDWPAFLAGADLIWKRMPATWYEGPFLGNGFLGSGIYAQPGANAVRFNVQHSQV